MSVSELGIPQLEAASPIPEEKSQSVFGLSRPVSKLQEIGIRPELEASPGPEVRCPSQASKLYFVQEPKHLKTLGIKRMTIPLSSEPKVSSLSVQKLAASFPRRPRGRPPNPKPRPTTAVMHVPTKLLKNPRTHPEDRPKYINSLPRGRPPKDPSRLSTAASPLAQPPTAPAVLEQSGIPSGKIQLKRKRGRPRKLATSVVPPCTIGTEGHGELEVNVERLSPPSKAAKIESTDHSEKDKTHVVSEVGSPNPPSSVSCLSKDAVSHSSEAENVPESEHILAVALNVPEQDKALTSVGQQQPIQRPNTEVTQILPEAESVPPPGGLSTPEVPISRSALNAAGSEVRDATGQVEPIAGSSSPASDYMASGSLPLLNLLDNLLDVAESPMLQERLQSCDRSLLKNLHVVMEDVLDHNKMPGSENDTTNC